MLLNNMQNLQWNKYSSTCAHTKHELYHSIIHYGKYEPAISTEIEYLPANVDSHADSAVPPKQMILLTLPSRLQYTSLESKA